MDQSPAFCTFLFIHFPTIRFCIDSTSRLFIKPSILLYISNTSSTPYQSLDGFQQRIGISWYIPAFLPYLDRVVLITACYSPAFPDMIPLYSSSTTNTAASPEPGSSWAAGDILPLLYYTLLTAGFNALFFLFWTFLIAPKSVLGDRAWRWPTKLLVVAGIAFAAGRLILYVPFYLSSTLESESLGINMNDIPSRFFARGIFYFPYEEGQVPETLCRVSAGVSSFSTMLYVRPFLLLSAHPADSIVFHRLCLALLSYLLSTRTTRSFYAHIASQCIAGRKRLQRRQLAHPDCSATLTLNPTAMASTFRLKCRAMEEWAPFVIGLPWMVGWAIVQQVLIWPFVRPFLSLLILGLCLPKSSALNSALAQQSAPPQPLNLIQRPLHLCNKYRDLGSSRPVCCRVLWYLSARYECLHVEMYVPSISYAWITFSLHFGSPSFTTVSICACS